MLRLNIYVKFALIALCLIGGAVLAYLYGFWYAFPILLIGVLLLVSYFLLGTVQSAAEFVERQDFEGARRRLKLTLFPRLLYKTNRAFYYIIHGTIALAEGKRDEAEEFFKRAEGIKLHTDDEKAMVYMQLATIYATKSQWNKGLKYYRELKKLHITQKIIKEQVAQLDRVFQQGSLLKNPAMRRHMKQMRPGGKKRRPRLR